MKTVSVPFKKLYIFNYTPALHFKIQNQVNLSPQVLPLLDSPSKTKPVLLFCWNYRKTLS